MYQRNVHEDRCLYLQTASVECAEKALTGGVFLTADFSRRCPSLHLTAGSSDDNSETFKTALSIIQQHVENP